MLPELDGDCVIIADSAPPIAAFRDALSADSIDPLHVAQQALAKSNQNASANVYLSSDSAWTLAEAKGLLESRASKRPLLFALPVSLKDCFDLKGFRTTAGTRFYAEKNPVAGQDSAVAARLRAHGALITGKTHLHPLAYGITGENRDFADCLQPDNAGLLTGGSTSGGAASVQEGSALAAIGTDTGGSIRVPAALCGLAGYRASIDLAWRENLWAGGVHLAQSFDALGWIFRDLRDAPLLAEALFGLKAPDTTDTTVRIAAVAPGFLDDCDAVALSAFETCKEMLRVAGASIESFDAAYWEEALSIYAPLQASEAAAIHADAVGGDYSVFPSPIDERLAWGASLREEELAQQRTRHVKFQARVDEQFAACDFLILPCSPISKLYAGKDHSQTRTRILRYTTPLSLAGVPVVTLPFPGGAGIQLAAPRGQDARLLAYARSLAPALYRMTQAKPKP